MENMKLWDSVCTTDPGVTKAAKVGGHEFTAIDPQSQRKQATELFGPFGIAWGVEDARGEFITLDDSHVLYVYNAMLWYRWEGETGKFPITSAVKAMYRTSGKTGYLKIDDDCTKKAATNAVSKGLSFLGFNADVFLGKFDDEKYVQAAREFSKSVIGGVERQRLESLMSEAEADRDAFLEYFGATSLQEFPQHKFSDACEMLAKKIRKNLAEAGA